MKTKTLTVALAILTTLLQAQTRGTMPGEYYISGQWYLNSQNQYVYAIWRTTDNGQTLALQYSSTTFPEQGYHLNLLSDATSGVLYATTQNKLYISYDYA